MAIIKAAEIRKRMAASADVQKAVFLSWGPARSDPEGAMEVIEWAKDPKKWRIYAPDGDTEGWEYNKEIAEDYLEEYGLNMIAIATLGEWDELEDQTMMYIMDNGTFEDHSGSGFGKF